MALEKWQRDGFESFGAWRRADQKRRDDAKRAARAAASAPSPSPSPLAVALAMPFASGAREVNVMHTCPSTCTLRGKPHCHTKRVRIASTPIAPVIGQLVTPVAPLTLTITDPDMVVTLALQPDAPRHLAPHIQAPLALATRESSPRAHFRGSQEHIQVTPGGSRVHKMERATPRGTRLTAEYTSPAGTSVGGFENSARYEWLVAAAPGDLSKPQHPLALSDRSRAAQSRAKKLRLDACSLRGEASALPELAAVPSAEEPSDSPAIPWRDRFESYWERFHAKRKDNQKRCRD